MSEMETGPARNGEVPFQRLRVTLGMLPQPGGDPPFIWVERWDAFIVGVLVAFGVPLLGWSGLDSFTKMLVLIAWLAVVPPFFMYFEGRELIGQMLGRGSIKPDQLSRQQRSATQGPFYGCIIAAFIWLVVYAIYVTVSVVQQFVAEPGAAIIPVVGGRIVQGFADTPVHFGIIEWFIIAHTWVSTNRTNHIMQNVGNIFSKATPMGERVERKVSRGE